LSLNILPIAHATNIDTPVTTQNPTGTIQSSVGGQLVSHTVDLLGSDQRWVTRTFELCRGQREGDFGEQQAWREERDIEAVDFLAIEQNERATKSENREREVSEIAKTRDVSAPIVRQRRAGRWVKAADVPSV
jgi:hypothetical protein